VEFSTTGGCFLCQLFFFQKEEVKRDVYQKLGSLPEYEGKDILIPEK